MQKTFLLMVEVRAVKTYREMNKLFIAAKIISNGKAENCGKLCFLQFKLNVVDQRNCFQLKHFRKLSCAEFQRVSFFHFAD